MSTAEKDKVAKAVQKLQRDRIVIFRINALTRIGREELMSIFSRLFEEFQLNPALLFNLYSAVVEVIFNAIKANAKHIVFKSEVKMKLLRQNFEDIDTLLQIIFREEVLRDFMTRHIIPEKLKKRVNTILQLEEKKRTGRGGPLSEKDLEALREFKRLIEDEEVLIHFTIAMTEDRITFNVVNDIPILAKDMARIEQSRSTHKKLFDEGRSTDYFGPDYIDLTESAGFGIAMADEIYYEMGLDPMRHFTISASEGSTRAVMYFPREKFAF
ncbi:MAG: hypothetical protein J0L53_07040 [Spirochaetes bacterium]|nr:hypothetical protein [Spirochaetota bacterium]MBX3721268.1 hypothetical protein [Turneriella sp.]